MGFIEIFGRVDIERRGKWRELHPDSLNANWIII
jgi:hypothetical protein